VQAKFRDVRLAANIQHAYFTAVRFSQNANLIFRRISLSFHRLVLTCGQDEPITRSKKIEPRLPDKTIINQGDYYAPNAQNHVKTMIFLKKSSDSIE